MRQTILLAACFAVLSVLYLHGLGGVGLLGPDEPRYASIGREMARSGDWVTPRLWGEAWFEKPALLYWMIGGAYRLGFGDDLAPRVGVALLSLAFLAFFWSELRREFGDTPAFYSAAVLATSAGWFAFSQTGVTDLPLAATFGAAMMLALRWVRCGGRRGLMLAGALLGAAVLAKGLVPLVLAAPLLWVGRRRWRDLFGMAAACLVVALPWYLLCYLRNGWPFIAELFVEHHFSRLTSDALQHVQPWWFYIPVIVAGLFPWCPMAALLFSRTHFADPRRVLLLLWAGWGLLFFSISTNKLPGYVLPLLPAVAALAGIRLAELRRPFGLVALSALLLGAVGPLAQVLPAALADGLSRAPMDAIRWTSGLPAVLLAAGVWILERRHRTAAVALTAGAAVAAILWLQVALHPALDREVSVRELWRESHPGCLEPYSRRHVEYGLNFYAGRRLPECESKR